MDLHFKFRYLLPPTQRHLCLLRRRDPRQARPADLGLPVIPDPLMLRATLVPAALLHHPDDGQPRGEKYLSKFFFSFADYFYQVESAILCAL